MCQPLAEVHAPTASRAMVDELADRLAAIDLDAPTSDDVLFLVMQTGRPIFPPKSYTLADVAKLHAIAAKTIGQAVAYLQRFPLHTPSLKAQ